MPLHSYFGYDVHMGCTTAYSVRVECPTRPVLNNCAVGVFELKSLDLLPGPIL